MNKVLRTFAAVRAHVNYGVLFIRGVFQLYMIPYVLADSALVMMVAVHFSFSGLMVISWKKSRWGSNTIRSL